MATRGEVVDPLGRHITLRRVRKIMKTEESTRNFLSGCRIFCPTFSEQGQICGKGAPKYPRKRKGEGPRDELTDGRTDCGGASQHLIVKLMMESEKNDCYQNRF